MAKRCPVRAQLDHDSGARDLPRVPETDAERARMDAGNEFEQRMFDLVASTQLGCVRLTGSYRARTQEATVEAMRGTPSSNKPTLEGPHSQ